MKLTIVSLILLTTLLLGGVRAAGPLTPLLTQAALGETTAAVPESAAAGVGIYSLNRETPLCV